MEGDVFSSGILLAISATNAITFIITMRIELNNKMPTKRRISFGTLFILFALHIQLVT